MKKSHIFLVFLLVALFGSGCASDLAEDSSQVVSFTTVEQTNHSAITGPRFVVVKDARSWNELWTEHTRNIQPAPTAPAIDFNEAMVLGVFVGDRPNTCYKVAIEAVEQVANERLLVKYREAKTGSVCGQAITQPSHLVSLQTMELPVEFVALS